MKKILFILFFTCASATLFAQSNTVISFPIGLPMGDINTYIGKPSFRGINFDYRHHVNPNLALGVNVSWHVFYEELASDTYTAGTETLTGKQYRYSNHVPMAATVSYFLSPDADIMPFVSLGIGTMYSRRNTNMNLYTLEEEAWNFLLQPEVGVQKVVENVGLHLSAKFNYGFKAGDELTEAQSFLAINVGFTFH